MKSSDDWKQNNLYFGGTNLFLNLLFSSYKEDVVMEEKEDLTNMDYYKALECDRTATYDELKNSYRRLILSSHPDKENQNEEAFLRSHNDDAFLRIRKAWSVLQDPLARKQYDAKLSCYEHSECFLYDTISLTDMEMNSEGFYTYPCRCGGTYVCEISDEDFSNVLVGCNECSFSIQVNILQYTTHPQAS